MRPSRVCLAPSQPPLSRLQARPIRWGARSTASAPQRDGVRVSTPPPQREGHDTKARGLVVRVALLKMMLRMRPKYAASSV